MKKLLHKIRIRRAKAPLPDRITSDTVAQHREHILAGGRRFKYPVQYARHKLVINAIIISVAALIFILALGWWQLYPAQNTSEFMYRVTKVVPVPVAYVDGQPVLYSDYLMKYLSSVHYLEQKEQVSLKSDDGKRRIDFIKQNSMHDAIADSYAKKLANGLKLSISNDELNRFIKDQRKSSDGEISEQTYDAVILDYFNWSPSEYRHITEAKLLRQKVSYAVDKIASKTADDINSAIMNNVSIIFKDSVAKFSSDSGLKITYGTSGLVPKTNQDGGLAAEASKLQKQQVSPMIKSGNGDGYYFVRLLDINDTQVSYEYIQVPLTVFTKDLENIEKSNKVNYFISVPKS